MGFSWSAYKILRRSMKALGYDIVIVKKDRKLPGYEPILPLHTYAPWLEDAPFAETYGKIREHTMVDEYRCYELWQLLPETKGLEGPIVEVGVWRGGSGVLIAKRAELLGIRDRVYLCDTFAGVVKAGKHDSYFRDGEHSDASQALVEGLAEKNGLKNVTVLKGVFPDDTGKSITEDKIRFCHIDVDVYQSAKDVMGWLWPRLVPGGIIVVDDYGSKAADGITRFVNEEREKADRKVIHNLNGHGIIIKTTY
jgi:O-methyltransferase